MNTEKLEKLKKSLDNKFIPDNMKDKIRAEIKKLEADIKTDDTMTTTDIKSEVKEIEKEVEKALDVAEKKEEQAQAKAPAKTRTKRTTTSRTKKPKVEEKPTAKKKTFTAIAKEIRKAGESWEDAKLRARKMMKSETTEIKKKTRTETDKLLAMVRRNKEYKKLAGTSNLSKDAQRRAMPRGKRVSKTGNVYYENRANRVDVGGFKSAYLENGGGVGMKYIVEGDRVINTHTNMYVDYDFRTKKNAEDFANHRNRMFKKFGKDFADGGTIIGTPETPLARDLGISYTGLVGETGAMSSGEMFMAGGSTDREDFYSKNPRIPRRIEITKKQYLSKKSSIKNNKWHRNLVDPMGYEDDKGVYWVEFDIEADEKSSWDMYSWITKNIPSSEIKIFVQDKNFNKYEQGGSLVDGYLTDPNFGDFQAGVYEMGGNTGLPAGAEQSYVNYYLNEGATAGMYAKGGGVDYEYDAIAYAKTKGKESVNWDKELREYAGSQYSKLTAREKEEIISDMQKDWDSSHSYAKGGGVKKRSLKSVIHLVDWKGEGIKKWYLRSYPTDEMGEELDDTVTFKDLWDALNERKNVYEIIGVGDSLIRERLFEYLSLIYNVDYDVVYNKWLDSDDYAKGGGVRMVGGREYPTGRNWTNEHRHIDKADSREVNYKRKRSFADGGEVRRFDRQAQMDSETREEILDILSESDTPRGLTNYLYGLFDGYDYSETTEFKKEVEILKRKNPKLHQRLVDIYKKIDKYKFENYKDNYAKGGVTNERRYVNKSQDYEVRYAKSRPSRKGYKGKRSFAGGGGIEDNAPSVYIADLEAYNNGRLVGKWFNLLDYSDADEFNEAVADFLKETGAEEYAVHDFENIPRSMQSEYLGVKDFEEIYEMIDLARDKDLPLEVVMEVTHELGESAVDEFYGVYDSKEDFAEQLVDDLGIENFNNFEYYLEISDTDRRLLAQDMADSYVDDIRDEDGGNRLIEEAGLDVEEYEEADSDRQEEMLDEAREIVYDQYYDTWYDGLDDPYYFLVEEQGLYSADDFAKADFVRVDIEKLARELEYDYTFIRYDGQVYVFSVR